MKKIFKRLAGLSTAAAVFVYMPAAAFAKPYDIGHSDVHVVAEVNANGKTIYKVNDVIDDTQIVIKGDSGVLDDSHNHVYIESAEGADALIVFENLMINNPSTNAYAVRIAGEGNVTIELDGEDNRLQSGQNRAGIQKESTGSLTIKDDDKNGSLYVKGSTNGAGIGGGDQMDGTDIIIKGGTIEAQGGDNAAGIGGGFRANGTDITIKGGTIKVTGGSYGAGIGGGYNGSLSENNGNGMNITIEGGVVEANGGSYGAGIGSGYNGNGEGITVTGGTVKATGGYSGSGIGGGYNGNGEGITVTGGTVTASGGNYAAGIGGGAQGAGDSITIKGGTVTAAGGGNSAGIGGGETKSGTNILIEGGTVTAIAGGNAAGIGGAQNQAGEVEISGGTVIAQGGEGGGAGIGSGKYNTDASVTVTGSAVIFAAGGLYDPEHAGAAIGGGVTFNSNYSECYDGTEQEIDLSELYTTGSVTRFAGGTTVDEMKEHPELGVKETGTKPVPAQVIEEQEPTKEEPSTKEPTKPSPEKKPAPAVYNERSYMADINVADRIAAALAANAGAKEITLDYGDNICLSGDMMKDLFADSRVAKNCIFSYKGKRYNMHVGAVNTSSKAYTDCFNKLAAEPDSLAGFMKMAEIYKPVGVTLKEITE